MIQHRVQIPMYVHVSKKTKKPLNLNCYRNLHHQSSNNQKKEFKRLMRSQILGLPKMKKIHVHYIIHPKVKREFDVGNVASIVDKFFSDALVELGVLPDDNYKFIPSTSCEFGGFTHDEPHVIAVISDLKTRNESEKPMRILLDDNDFRQAVEDFVVAKGIASYSGIEINVVDGKIEAEVLIDSLGTTSPNPAPEVVSTADIKLHDVIDDEENKRLELVEEARAANIKGIRGNMTIETLREKLQEHNDENTPGGTADVDADGGSGDTSGAKGSIFSTEGSTEGSEEEATPDNSANPSEGSPEDSSPASEASEAGDTPPAEETVAETPPAKKSSIFDAD